MKWLMLHNFEYSFHDYKELGIDKKTIQKWLKKRKLEEIINLRSTTYKNLSETDKEKTKNIESAIDLMILQTSIIKRPVLEFNNKILVGFNLQEWGILLKI